MEEFTEHEVLGREELPLTEKLNPRAFKIEGEWPRNRFKEGGNFFVPVQYKGKPYKRQQRIKQRDGV